MSRAPRRRARTSYLGFALACALALPPAPARAQEQQVPLMFGQSAALSGTYCTLGLGMEIGLRAAFHEANAKGGVNGRRISLRTLDDAYEQELAVNNTRRLIEEEDVFALIGGVGTPASNAAEPIASAAGVPYIAPLTGAPFLRSPERRRVINLRASYYQEAEEVVERLTRDRGIERIGLLYQDDSFGLTLRDGVSRALKARKLSLVSEGAYPNNTEAVKTALVDIRLKRPQAVILAGHYKPVATFIKWARRFGFNPVFVATSLVGSAPLASALGKQGRGVFVTQVVPFPESTSLPVVAEYRSALRAAPMPKGAKGCKNFSARAPDFVSLEGYLAGRLTLHALGRIEGEWTRENFLEVLRSEEAIELGGLSLHFGASDNQGLDKVYLTSIGENSRYQPINNLRKPRQ